MMSPPFPEPPAPPLIPPTPRSPPLPPSNPPAPPPILLMVADWVSWAGLSVLLAMIVVSVGLRVAVSFRTNPAGSFPRSRRSSAVGLLRALAGLSVVSAGLVFYGEARFSVMTSYSAAGINNIFVRAWNDADTVTRSAIHYGMWGWVALAFAVAGAALSMAELLSREQPQAAPSGQRFRKVRWHLGNSKASLALMFVFVGSAAILAGKTIDQATKYDWGVGWDASKDRHGRAYWLLMLEASAFYAAFAGLLPMTLIGVPLGRTSALWRALGRSYEEAIAFHRALGHLMMAAFTYHGVGYMVSFIVREHGSQ